MLLVDTSCTRTAVKYVQKLEFNIEFCTKKYDNVGEKHRGSG